ncbi:type IX secretion system membrane protein, PorP/SprF family [Flavobacteriaceae bacterium MAR_2010_188]|nr:type IX secretion system membrane protein, PorP/SprF family [Flavobacteriaceae bacterium MAR_2010_188]
MKYLKIILLQGLLLLMPVFSIAQQLPQFSQYMYNTISINPAYAGSREIMVINLLNRNQWVGVNGAPVTQTLSVHSSVPGTKLGLGLSVINDKLGYDNTTYIYSDVSYTLNLSDKYWLAFGLKVGASKFSLDDDIYNDPAYNNDPYLDYLYNGWDPNFGVGIYFRSDKFYMGLSSPKLVNYKKRSDLDYIPIDRVSYYLNGGYLWEYNSSNLKFKPTFLLKYTNGAPLSVDVTGNVLLYDKLWLGLSYRLKDSFGAMANFNIAKGLNIGYAYDYITSDLAPFTSGSHEIILQYEFNFPRPRCKCTDLHN